MSSSILTVPSVRPAFHPPARLLERALTSLLGAARSASREWQLRRDLDALASLDSRALADLGIGRGEMENAVRQGRGGLARAGFTPLAAHPEAPLMPASWTEWR